jgi:hypothetical protein
VARRHGRPGSARRVLVQGRPSRDRPPARRSRGPLRLPEGGLAIALRGAGRIDYHPVFPGRRGFGARRIEPEADVEDVLALMRSNYERVVANHGLPKDAAAQQDRGGGDGRIGMAGPSS